MPLISAVLCWCLLLVLTSDVTAGSKADPRQRLLLLSRLAQAAEQSSADSSGGPFLPGVPGGPSMPVPPTAPQEPAVKGPEPVVNGDNLMQGTGKYSGMVLIPGGMFEMGSPEGEGRPDERPRHQVFVKDFYVAKYEVTVKDYCRFLKAEGENSREGSLRIRFDIPDCPIVKSGNSYVPKDGSADKPVVCVSWYGAAEYAEWAGGRLPTAAEREKAALYTTPNPPGDRLVFQQLEGPVPVSAASVGARGITGMFGNVWEWCADWYSRDYYAQSPANNPTGPALGEEKEIRGGSWASPESSCRTRNRHKASPRGYFRTVGFRIVKD